MVRRNGTGNFKRLYVMPRIRFVAVFLTLILVAGMVGYYASRATGVTVTKSVTAAPALAPTGTVNASASGVLSNLNAADASVYDLLEGYATNKRNYQLEAQFNSWTPLNYSTEIAKANISKIEILGKGYVGDNTDLDWNVSMWNYTTGAWDTAGLSAASVTLGQGSANSTAFTITVTGTANIQNYLNSSGNYQVRLASTDFGTTAQDATQTTLSLDQLQVRFTGDTTAPVANWVGPATGTYKGVINLQATASDSAADDSGVNRVEFQYKASAGSTWTSLGNGTQSGAGPTYTYTYSLDTTTWGQPDGSYNFRAIAYDNVGNSTTVPTTVPVVTTDNTKPAVSSTNPTGNQTGVAITTAVTATFSENVSNISGTSFTLSQGANQVAGTVTYNSSTKTATFTPSAALSNNTQYTATLTTGITDAVGNALTQYTWNFTTLASSDTQSPSQPGQPSGTGINDSQINLTWAASTDNVGVTGYEIWRNNGGTYSQIGTSATNSYSDTSGLSPNTTYQYYVIAYDAAGNKSIASAVGTGTTTADTTPPSAPTVLTGNAVSGTEIDLTWTASTDNVGVIGYQVWRSDNGGSSYSQIATSTTTAYNDTGLLDGKNYYYYVKAYDTRNNISGASNTINKATIDVTAPSVPSNLNATGINETQINLTWTASTDNVGVTQYQVFRSTDNVNFTSIGTATGTTYSATGLTVNTNYYFYVKAYDAANNASAASNTASAKTVDATAPTAPGAPTLTVVNSSQINLTWAISSDNVGVAGYQIFRSTDGINFTQIATAATNSYSDTGLPAATKFYYNIKAYDAAGNVSAAGGTANATTQYSTQPQVISITPPNGEINIATGTNLQAVFNQDMDASTINSTNVTVKPNGGANLTGTTVTYDTATRTVTLTKTGGFAVSTNYIVTISAAVKNTSGLTLAGAYSWSFTTADQPYRFPHGKYVTATSQCATCHKSHSASGANLVQQTSIQATCYVCHNGTQASSNVQGEFNHNAANSTGSSHPVDLASPDFAAGTLSCNNCHNPHGDLDASNNMYPRLLNTGGATPAYQGNNVCWKCHGPSSAYPAPNGDHQSTWPGQSGSSTATPAGTGHDKASLMNPASGTQVECSSCHQPHGSSAGKNLLTSITFTNPVTSVTQTTTVTGANRTACYSCHFDKYSAAADNDWFGQSTYEATVTLPDGNHSNGHKGNDCQNCHEPHGTQWPNYLKSNYDMNASATRTTAYNQNDFQCTSCHSAFQSYTAPLTSSGTSFFNAAGATAAKKDLHYLHLQQAGIDGKGNAVCYECHRPHGAITSENPSQAHRVGFPAATVTATTVAPATAVTFQHNPQVSPKTGGGCTLSCHGVNHRSGTSSAGEIDARYDNSGSSAGASESSGGQACGSCHNTITGLFGTVSGGTITPGTGSYHHGITSDAAAYNDSTCLSCHVDHNVFSPSANPGSTGRAANLRVNGGNSTNQAQTNKDFDSMDPNGNGGLCLSCHNNNAVSSLNKRYAQPDGTTVSPTISIGAYSGSAHNYTVQSKFNSDSSIFYANCSKCHNDNDTTQSTFQNTSYPANPSTQVFKLHGSSIRRMLTVLNAWSTASSATAGITEPTAGKGLEENFCLKCHTGTSGTDMYGGTYWSGRTAIQNISAQYAKAYAHADKSTAGVHTPTESTAQGWNSGTNRHSECDDCHNAHAAKYNDGTDKEGVSSSLAGVWGSSIANPYTGTTGAGTPNTYTYSYSSAPTKQYEVCAKCHSTYAWTTSTNAPNSSWPGGGKQPDTIQQFNPGNYSTHAVLAPGANQPSPTANPNWASNTLRRTGSYSVNGTSYTVSGLDNTFVDGWGVKSMVQCSDCHASDTKGEPRGPHGSTQKWILKKLDTTVTVTTASGVQNPNQHSLTGNLATAANDAFCLNCHRADVYGYGSTNFPTYSGTNATNMSRWSHGSANAADMQSNLVNGGKGNTLVSFGCLNCHGGGEAGGIHGSQMTAAGTAGADPPGKRFMNGASWNGHTGLNATSGTCYTGASNSVNTCTQHGRGTSLNYNYAY